MGGGFSTIYTTWVGNPQNDFQYFDDKNSRTEGFLPELPKKGYNDSEFTQRNPPLLLLCSLLLAEI